MAHRTKRVLVIEDDPMLIRLIAKALSAVGLVVVEAANGQEGIDAVRRERPDCILLDVIMPKVDGVTVIREVRKMRTGKRIPIICWTNVPLPELKGGIDARSVQYLSKADHSLQELVDTVVATVAKRQILR